MTLKGIGKALLEVDSENENLNSRKSASYFPTDYDPIGVIIVGNLQLVAISIKIMKAILLRFPN